MGQAEIADEHALASMGDAAAGIITAAQLRLQSQDNPMNKEFVKAYNADFNAQSRFLLGRRL